MSIDKTKGPWRRVKRQLEDRISDLESDLEKTRDELADTKKELSALHHKVLNVADTMAYYGGGGRGP